MKSYITILMTMLFAITTEAQRKHQANDQIKSLNWDIIGSVGFELDEQNRPVPKFGEMIKRFSNKTFILTGYLIPVKSGRKHLTFLLSPLPINQCFYCGQNGIPSMVLVTMKTPISYVEKPISVIGILKLSEHADESPIALEKSEMSN